MRARHAERDGYNVGMNDEHAMLMFARLAAVSAERSQQPGRDRFLILAGLAATRAGWPEVAARCHHVVTSQSPHHLLARYPSFADALRDADFESFARQLSRFCTPERAEHLLTQRITELSKSINRRRSVSPEV